MEKLNEIIWGPVMQMIYVGLGIYLTFKLGWMQIFRIGEIFQNTLGKLFGRREKGGVSPFAALSTALAGTLGTGNITGVAAAIAIGGPGAVVWMWISAFFGMCTKYAEIFLAVRYREKSDGGFMGGPMYYIKKGVGSKTLAVIFAAFCALAAFGIGNIAQMSTIIQPIEGTVPKMISGAAVTLMVFYLISGGIRRISRITEFAVPIFTVIFFAGCLCIIFIHANRLPGVLVNMFADAFEFKAAAGGVFGFLTAKAVRFGISRGVFSNEAGLGSSPIVHAAADCKTPHEQASWGVFEVFADSFLVSGVTAFALFCADVPLTLPAKAMPLAFEMSFGGYAGAFVSLSVIFFAVSSMVGWYYYGETAFHYLTGRKGIYKFAFTAVMLLSVRLDMTAALAISDALNGLMAMPNLLAVFLLRKQIEKPEKNSKNLSKGVEILKRV